MTFRLSSAGAVLLVGAAVMVAALVYVWRRRASTAAASLGFLLLASVLWSVCYAMELHGGDIPTKQLWGDLKYLGIGLLPAAWLVFMLTFTGRRPTRGFLALLAVEPLLLLVLLANSATHDLVRYYPPGATVASHPVASNGILFWPNAIYIYALIWTGTFVFVRHLGRISHIYRGQSLLLLVSVLAPFTANVLYDLDVGPFGHLDLTPFLCVVTGLVLVWGVFGFRLPDLVPVGRSRSFDTIADAVIVTDHIGRVIDCNPAAERLLGQPIARLIGQTIDHLLPTWSALAPYPASEDHKVEAELAGRSYELHVSPLKDRHGQTIGQLLVARDITDRLWAEADLRTTLERLRNVDEQRQDLLSRLVDAQESERRRIASTLNAQAVQSLSTAVVRLRAQSLSQRPEERRRLLEEVVLPMTTALDHLRGLLAELRQPVFDQSGMAAAIDQYAQIIRGTGADVEIKSHVRREIPGPAQVTAFRVAQEALINVRRHALASMVTITIEESGDGLLVRIEDNGVGFEPPHGEPGPDTPGLHSMDQRAKAAGGWWKVDSAAGEGTTVEFWLPA
jgi:signal transduction histidine kinase